MAHRQPINVQEDVKAISRDRELVEPLQKQVANALVLYMNYKHYHWQTSGPLFRDLHLLFDEFANAVLETVDEFAERIRMIGPDADVDDLVQEALITVVRRAATLREHGLGLGLYISDQIARLHGGRLEVRSVENEGTDFVLDLPRRPG